MKIDLSTDSFLLLALHYLEVPLVGFFSACVHTVLEWFI